MLKKTFDWEQFWIDHPKKQLMIPHNEHWANLRPSDYDYWDAFYEIVRELGGIDLDNKILEVGCGTGIMLPLAASYLSNPERQLAAVDISQTMVETARINNPLYTITKASAHILPFLDGEFDKVYLTGVIQYVPSTLFEATMKEIMRVTKLGGKVFVGDVLEKTSKAAEVFTYSKEQFKAFGDCKFSKSDFENRLNVLIEKKDYTSSTFDNQVVPEWGTGNI